MAQALLDVGAMTRCLVVMAVIALSTANARAEPEPRGSVGLGASFGGLSHVSGLALAGLDGTWRHGADTWLHVMVAGGVPFVEVTGSAAEVRVGLEHRRQDCLRGCLYGGIDLAYVDADVIDDPGETHARGLLVIPRGGIDVGGDAVRFRLGIELLLGGARVRERLPDLVVPMDTTATRFVGGFALTAGVAAQF
ncbi:MAG TPA: hypothetical protein VF469_23410 [Kofleriaceae bacterium]